MTKSISVFSALFLAMALGALDAGASDDKEGQSIHSYILSGRVRWWVAQVSGSFQVNKKDIRGSYADYRDDLDLKAFDPKANPGIPSVELEAQLGNSSLILDWIESSMSGSSFVDRMNFNGQQYVQENIRTDMDLRLWRFTYMKHLLSNDFVRASLAVGGGYIDYRIEVTPDPASPAPVSHAGGNSPFPYVGGRAHVTPFKYFEVLADFLWSGGDWGDARLLFVDSTLSIHCRPMKAFSFGLGFHFFHLFANAINVWESAPDTLLVTLSGPFFELEARF